METLLQRLASRYPIAAQCAAALGMSRQAFSQATARGRLSPNAAMLAATLLGLEPGAALAANFAGKDIAAPVIETTPDPAPYPADNSGGIQIMRTHGHATMT